MGKRYTGVREHYERMIDEIDDPAHPAMDPFHDPPWMAAWLAQADGPAFFAALGDVRGWHALEIGVGTGRVAKKVLDAGCARLTGLDISPKTLARARQNLAGYANVELLEADIQSFVRAEAFDVAYCVWAFFHFEDQPRALANIVASLKPGGRLALSLEQSNAELDYGSRIIRQHPVTTAQVAAWLTALGCCVGPPVTVTDAFADGAPVLTTILRADKLGYAVTPK